MAVVVVVRILILFRSEKKKMFGTQTNGGLGGTDAYEREKIRILQALNVQVKKN